MTETQRNIVHLIIGFLVFPVLVLGVIPGILIHHYGMTLPHPTDVGYWFAKVFLPAGFVLATWTVALFFLFGKGTPAPWAPPKHLVVIGPYRFVRNPMMLGVLMLLLGEALILSSTAIALWFATAFALIHLMVVFYEEPGLKKRFGEDYTLYQAHVGRWLPRFSAWVPPWEPREDPEAPDPQATHWEGYTPGKAEPAADNDKNTNQP